MKRVFVNCTSSACRITSRRIIVSRALANLFALSSKFWRWVFLIVRPVFRRAGPGQGIHFYESGLGTLKRLVIPRLFLCVATGLGATCSASFAHMSQQKDDKVAKSAVQ